jgi:hypothetical protein
METCDVTGFRVGRALRGTATQIAWADIKHNKLGMEKTACVTSAFNIREYL